MMTDLIRDWISGPPTDYQKFVPMIYAFRLELHHYELNLYVNDHNIIDKPLIRDENGKVHHFRIAVLTIILCSAAYSTGT